MTNSTEFPRGFPRKLEGVVGKRAGNTERKPGRVREETLGQANARHSLYFRLFGEFVMNTYSAALQRGWSNRIRPGYPDMKNVPALMELARELHLDSGPEQRLATGCSFIAAVHDASLDVLTNKRWRVPTTCDVVSCLKMPGVPESVPLPACSFDEQITGGSSTCPI